jgi:hypothetical protein
MAQMHTDATDIRRLHLWISEFSFSAKEKINTASAQMPVKLHETINFHLRKSVVKKKLNHRLRRCTQI